MFIHKVTAFSLPWEDDDDITDLDFWEDAGDGVSSLFEGDSGGGYDSGDLSNLFDSQDTKNLYPPQFGECPSFDIFREAKGLNNFERAYLEGRQVKSNENLEKFLKDVAQLSDFDAEDFVSKYNVSIGLAFSGGGYRALLNGGGQMLALDNRYEDANSKGLGGLLQSANYISGLSGGAWLVGSIILNGWISVKDIISGEINVWDLQSSIFSPRNMKVTETADYYMGIREAVNAKSDAGFDSSLTDIWGRALSYQLLESKTGLNLTWSDIVAVPEFRKFEVPFPIILSDARDPGTDVVNLNSSVFEMTPFELGSWDPSVNSFVDMRYIGTDLDNGEFNKSKDCVTNFDNAGFLMGTSSTLFNRFLTEYDGYSINKYLKGVIQSVMKGLDREQNDVAEYQPNPFYNSEYGDNQDILQSKSLHLVDGSQDEQNIPFYPYIQKERPVDVIVAFDNSGDTQYEWPNGSAIIHSFNRQFNHLGKGNPIPFVPETYEKFMDEGLHDTPAFFGCDLDNLEPLVEYHDTDGLNTTDIPLIVHIPNHDVSFASNFSTFSLSISYEDRQKGIENGYNVASRSNTTEDENWQKCVGCAVIRRTQQKFNLDQSDECKQCFKQYCWEPKKSETSGDAVSSMAAESTETDFGSGAGDDGGGGGDGGDGDGDNNNDNNDDDDDNDDDSTSSDDLANLNSISLTLVVLSIISAHLFV